MKWISLGTCILFCVVFVVPTTGQTLTLDRLSGVTVYLHLEETQSVVKDGVRYEIWLKVPADKNASIPYVVTKESASGFLVTDTDRLFLVTAAHVAKDANPNWSATVRTGEDHPTTFSLSQLVGGRPLKWVFHESADVAVASLEPDAIIRNLLSQHFLPIDSLSSKLSAPPREQPLTALGFPLSLGAMERFSPISRQFFPASGLLTLPRFDTGQPATFFLLDSASTDGFSGAPVFTWPLVRISGTAITTTGKLEMVGLIHGTVSDKSGGKFGAIVPASFIVETIKKAGGG